MLPSESATVAGEVSAEPKALAIAWGVRTQGSTGASACAEEVDASASCCDDDSLLAQLMQVAVTATTATVSVLRITS
ncbi:hypothetical protein BOH72_20985 [Mycobacterium sp. WY10]|nr:hypothetical protein BOH72_20985 [Mycobacterium sp. WY10]